MANSLIKKVEVFNFGKYKDVPIINVLKKDPEYIDWLLKTIKGHKKELKIIQEIKNDSHNILLKEQIEINEFKNLKEYE